MAYRKNLRTILMLMVLLMLLNQSCHCPDVFYQLIVKGQLVDAETMVPLSEVFFTASLLPQDAGERSFLESTESNGDFESWHSLEVYPTCGAGEGVRIAADAVLPTAIELELHLEDCYQTVQVLLDLSGIDRSAVVNEIELGAIPVSRCDE